MKNSLNPAYSWLKWSKLLNEEKLERILNLRFRFLEISFCRTNGFPFRSIKLILISIVRKMDLISEFFLKISQNLEHSYPNFQNVLKLLDLLITNTRLVEGFQVQGIWRFGLIYLNISFITDSFTYRHCINIKITIFCV